MIYKPNVKEFNDFLISLLYFWTVRHLLRRTTNYVSDLGKRPFVQEEKFGPVLSSVTS